ncbi:MAG: hypothetical protein IJH94_06730 [Clostridia bacterium]|nr:hypothetical protein [Clostridia bacterium]
MRKYIITSLFLLLLAGSVLLFALPGDRESILSENREPKQMPAVSAASVLDGSFEAGFDEYVNDNTAFRSQLMYIFDTFHSRRGFTPVDTGRIISATTDIGTGAAQDSRLVLYNGRIMEMFSASEENENSYAETLNNIRESIPDGVEMYSMLIPTQLEFCDASVSNAQDSERKEIDRIYGMLSEAIKPVDVYGKVQTAWQGDGYLYYWTDHHWNMNGAYCGYEAFAEAAGYKPKTKDKYSYNETGSFYGSLYLKAKSELSPDQPKDICFYYDTAEKGNIKMKMRAEDAVTEYAEGSPVFHTDTVGYGIFFGGDNPLMEITNEAKPDGETLMIVKDSYANAFIPWLINDFKRVIVIDPRSFGGSYITEIERYGVDKVLFENYVLSTTYDDYWGILASRL